MCYGRAPSPQALEMGGDLAQLCSDPGRLTPCDLGLPSVPDEIPDVYIVERLFSSSLVVVVSHTKPRQMNVYHFKKGTEICNYSYSSNILSIRLNRQVSGGDAPQITRLLLIGTEEKDGYLLNEYQTLKGIFTLRPSIMRLL